MIARQVQLAADGAGWRKKPSDPHLKNFTAFVVKVVHGIQRWRSDEQGNEVEDQQRVGDAVNSLHNSKLALLYAGKDSYHMMESFLTAPQHGRPSIMEQLQEIVRDGVDVPASDPSQQPQHVNIVLKGGGDGKFQADQFGHNGHAGKCPCQRCEAEKGQLHLSKADLQARGAPARRTYQRSCMLAHKWGQQWGLEEPYHCPGCGRHITAEQRHLPATSTAAANFPKRHFGQYPDRAPLLPIEHWDFIPDLLHAFLRSVANMFFITVSMSLHTQQAAVELGGWMADNLGVEADPVFNQGARSSTKKNLQSWNGEECWKVLRGIQQIINQLHPVGSAGNIKLMSVWAAWTDLYAALLIDGVPAARWEELATVVDAKAAAWHRAFLTVAGPQDVTPTMHEIVCHFGDMIRQHGPLGPYSSENVEARHVPIKKMGKHRTNRKGAGAARTSAANTDIMQVMRRTYACEWVQQVVPKGKGSAKQRNSSAQDPLSMLVAQLQAPVLLQLGIQTSGALQQHD